MPAHRISSTPFAKVYPMYVQKAERKNRTKAEVDRVICWLTGYTATGLRKQIEKGVDFEAFFSEAPAIHPNSSLIEDHCWSSIQLPKAFEMFSTAS